MQSHPSQLVPGQRLVSDSEPELGLGTLVSADRRSVVVRFDAADEERRYAAASAPLHRVRFVEGDEITDVEGQRLLVDAVESLEGLAVYHCGERAVSEVELSPLMALGGPRERLLSGRFDPPRVFELRREALQRLQEARRSPVRGLVGPRLELLPHQFYIASEITSRRQPRVLLADETGLGKTIEACLILHRLLRTGRARRALILVPEALVHQWLVELSRRFNLRVALFDKERCAAMEADAPDSNPFEDEQLVLASWSLLAGDAGRTTQAAAAGWDLVVVDEAHHLSWEDGKGGAEYEAVERVSAAADGLLLLTATPTQLGEEGHFARLRLLDPERHVDFAAWQRENERHQETARLGAVLAADGSLAAEPTAQLAGILGLSDDEIRQRAGTPRTRAKLLADLIDRHGPGRVIFHNTRSVLDDLPARRVVLRPLAPRSSGAASADEISTGDPRIAHLETLLRASPDEKLLVICRTAATAAAIKDVLDRRLRTTIALFHEDIELVQRDRNAAWFVEPDGARMLVCSEIGSEGRNFQHARHLVMFDLPLDPDLVEQRIGRVDRIGQHREVLIDVPYVTGTGQEVLARWHHEGIGTFGRPVATAQPLMEEFGDRVRTLCAEWDGREGGRVPVDKLERLVAETARVNHELEAAVESGRDRLLEMSSLRRDVADSLLEEIREHDDDTVGDQLFLRLLEHYQVIADQLAPRTYRFDQQGLASVRFAALTRGDVTFTFDRETALLREDFEFASMDHPLMLDAIGFLLDSESGNASFAVHETSDPPLLLLEAIFVLEAVAPARLHVDRFLPPTCLRVVVDQTGADRTAKDDTETVLGAGNNSWFRERLPDLRIALTQMLVRADSLAEARAGETRKLAAAALRESLEAEIERLHALARTNDSVRPQEIALLESELEELCQHVDTARLRVEALRVVWSGPAQDGVPRLS